MRTPEMVMGFALEARDNRGMAILAKGRLIERVPALLISVLDQAGKLPHLPANVVMQNAHPHHRRITLAEGSALTWVVAWKGRRFAEADQFGPVAAFAGYRDVFDHATSRDVREVIHLAGSRDAIVELIRWLQAETREAGLGIIGELHVDNRAMERFVRPLGFRRTRVRWEWDG